jgi:hypothetical protein
MACDLATLESDASCFQTLAGPAQWESVKLNLLCQILQSLDPMADCDVQTLAASAKCFFTASTGGLGRSLELQLLCDIYTALSGGGGGTPLVGITSDAGDPALDGSITTLLYKDTDTNVKYVNTGTIAVPTWEAL